MCVAQSSLSSPHWNRYDVYKQSHKNHTAIFPGTRIFIRSFDGTFVEPSLRTVSSTQSKRSFLQRWTVSAGYRRREKHSSYIICSGEEILLRSHQGRYLCANENGKSVSTTGESKPRRQDRLWWRVIRHNEDQGRSSNDFLRSYETKLSPIRSGDLVRLVSSCSKHTLCVRDGEVSISNSSNVSIRAQHLFTIVIESMDLYPRPIRMLSTTLQLESRKIKEKKKRAKQILTTSRCLSSNSFSKCWVMIHIFSDGIVSMFSPRTGSKIRFRLDPRILSTEGGCLHVVSAMSLATWRLGLRGGVLLATEGLSKKNKMKDEQREFKMNLTIGSEKFVVSAKLCEDTGEIRLSCCCEGDKWCSNFFVDMDMTEDDDVMTLIRAFVKCKLESRSAEMRVRHARMERRNEILKRCSNDTDEGLVDFVLDQYDRSIDAAVRWIESGRAEKVYRAHIHVMKFN